MYQIDGSTAVLAAAGMAIATVLFTREFDVLFHAVANKRLKTAPGKIRLADLIGIFIILKLPATLIVPAVAGMPGVAAIMMLDIASDLLCLWYAVKYGIYDKKTEKDR